MKKKVEKINDKMVIYDNRFNRLTLANLNKSELNVLNFFLHALNEKGESEVIISLADIKKYSKIKDRSDSLLSGYVDEEGNTQLGILDSLNQKILEMKIPVEFEKKGIKFKGKFNLFSAYALSEDKKHFYIKIDKDYEFLINNITKYFTQYKLDDFTSLKSAYSKLLFQILKQWNTVGNFKMSMDEFREKLGVPESYRMSAVNSRVLKNIEKELPEYFSNFKIEKIKTGKNITSLKFTWDVVENNNNIEEAIILEPNLVFSEKLEKAIKKCNKNHFISDNKILNNDNIKILLKEFEEEDIIVALEKIYKIVKQDITELNYFKKVILSVKKERISKLNDEDVKKEKKVRKRKEKTSKEKIKDNNLELEFKVENEKIKLSQEEYNKIFKKEYRKYLKENNTLSNKFLEKAFTFIFNNKYELIK